MIVFSPLWIKIKVTDPDYFSFTLLLWLKLPLLVTVIRKSLPFRKWHRFPSQWVCLVCFHVDKAREGFISSPSVFPPALTSELQCSPPPLTKQDHVYSQAPYFLPPICSCHLSQSHSPVSVRSFASWPEDLQLISSGRYPFSFQGQTNIVTS